MPGGNAQIDFVQYTSDATPHPATLCLGYIPDYVVHVTGIEDTNSDVYEWANILTFDQWPAAADTLLTTGSSGIRTLATASIVSYAGGDTVTATDVTNKTYRGQNGLTLALGDVAAPGITIPALTQTASSKNFVRIFRAAR